MKKHVKGLFVTLLLIGGGHNFVVAQNRTVTLKSGTPIGLQAVNTVYAREVNEGDRIMFRVTSDVKAEGQILVSAGTTATGVVTLAKKSSLVGTKGRLTIDIKNLTLHDGTLVPLTGTIRITGKNRTPLSVITGVFVWPCFFIPGSKAVMLEGYDTTANVMVNTDIAIEQ